MIRFAAKGHSKRATLAICVADSKDNLPGRTFKSAQERRKALVPILLPDLTSSLPQLVARAPPIFRYVPSTISSRDIVRVEIIQISTSHSKLANRVSKAQP